MNGLDWLLSTGYVDPRKVGVFGGSYGGFMTLMLAAKEPDKFSAAVDLFGPLDWYTMIEKFGSAAEPVSAQPARRPREGPKGL